jgi:osmotically-inducible protein OsmY
MDPTEEPKGYLVQHIKDAFAHDPRVSELEIEVKIRANRVFLRGTVPTEERREALAAIAGDVARGHEIHNETVVATLSETPGVERLS